MKNTKDKTFTQHQLEIVNELCAQHGLDPAQISFEGNNLTPIFDYEAVCALSLRLTDIASIDTVVKPIDPMRHLQSVAVCTVTLGDGRSRSVEDSAEVDEVVGNGLTIENKREADGMAQNRAVRRGIRSVGINLWNAHKTFMKNGGSITEGTTANDPRAANYREIHALATELDMISDGDRSVYANYLDASFGVVSSKDLDDLQLHQLLVNLRVMVGLKRRSQQQAA